MMRYSCPNRRDDPREWRSEKGLFSLVPCLCRMANHHGSNGILFLDSLRGRHIRLETVTVLRSLMLCEETIRHSPRTQASPHIAEGFSPTARAAYRI